MTITIGYSIVEIRSFLAEYDQLPFGQKGKWVDAQPFSRKQLYHMDTSSRHGRPRPRTSPAEEWDPCPMRHAGRR